MDPFFLDVRKQQILSAVVDDYTETAVPVGSQILAARLLSWSSATIRSELANLVDIGYLIQPHTSAGRIPSERGYRYYVDFLMKEETIPAAARRQIDAHFDGPMLSVEELLEKAAQALAVLTTGVGIITGPRNLGAKVKHVDLVALDDQHMLLILVFEGNVVRQQAVQLSDLTTQAELSSVSARLNQTLVGKAVGDVETAVAILTGLAAEVGRHITAQMHSVDIREETIVVHDGVRNLLRNPEFGDIERLQQVLEVVEEERALGQLLTSVALGDGGLHMVIGTESGVEQLESCSLVLTTYRADDIRFGTIGVLGPTRMRYQQIAPRVRWVAQRTGEAFRQLLG